jgi:hypothetical protein
MPKHTRPSLRNLRRSDETRKTLSAPAAALQREAPRLFSSLSRRAIPYGAGEVSLRTIFDINSASDLERCLWTAKRHLSQYADDNTVLTLRQMSTLVDTLYADASTCPFMTELESRRHADVLTGIKAGLIKEIERLQPRPSPGARRSGILQTW